MTYLDYYKIILGKVSFDPQLFSKEYHKAKQILKSNEIGDLNSWIQAKGLSSHLGNQTSFVSTFYASPNT
jgi:hypothetical protein